MPGSGGKIITKNLLPSCVDGTKKSAAVKLFLYSSGKKESSEPAKKKKTEGRGKSLTIRRENRPVSVSPYRVPCTREEGGK